MLFSFSLPREILRRDVPAREVRAVCRVIINAGPLKLPYPVEIFLKIPLRPETSTVAYGVASVSALRGHYG